jgi:uncharacterized protein (TIGR02001 family)
MKLNKLSTLLVAASTLVATSSAMAWESEDGNHSTSANVAFSTDYMWRGYSQTGQEPALSGGFDYSHSSGFYAGTWASNVDFGDEASIEMDLYFGHAGETDNGIGWDVGLLRYLYPGEEYDYNEVYGFLSYSYFSVGITHGYDVYDSDTAATYYQAGFDYELPMGVALSAGIGYYDYEQSYVDAIWYGGTANGGPNDAIDYRIGVSKEFVGIGFDLSYIDVDSDGAELYGDNITDGRFVFTMSKSM